MFLNNYYHALSTFLADQYGFSKWKNVYGATLDTRSDSDKFHFGKNSSTYYIPTLHHIRNRYDQYAGVIIGTGTTPPQLEDYKLSGDMITTFSYSAGVTAKEENNGLVFTALYTITNTGTEAFTIGEIALMAGFGSDAKQDSKALVERTVLDAPVTIPAGGIGQVTYTIRLNYQVA